jgi:hypothetical protein
MTRTGTAAFYCVLSGLLWLGVHSCLEMEGAASQTAMQRLSAVPPVLGVVPRKDIAQTAGSEFKECAACLSLSPYGGNPRRQIHDGLV